ncbi:MAG: Spy/CpxP family protein refolding chaperone [Flavisolibacter sp.]
MKKILTGALAFILFAGAAQAQSKQDSSWHARPGGREMMAKQLNLTADQKAQFKTIHENQKKDMEALKAQSLTADQLKTQRQELHKKYQQQMQSVLTPAQRDQMAKFRAERKQNGTVRGQWKKNAGLQKELNLTQAQKDQLSKMRADVRTQMQSIRNDQSLTQDQKKEKMHSIMKDQREKFKSVLTKEQQEKLEAARKEHKDKVTK